jgi:hypothetical protein
MPTSRAPQRTQTAKHALRCGFLTAPLSTLYCRMTVLARRFSTDGAAQAIEPHIFQLRVSIIVLEMDTSCRRE